MELKLRDGDYVPNGCGGFVRVDGGEALVQRVLFRLTARRGAFPFLETLGSRLHLLGRVPESGRQSAAEQYVAEALAEETDLTVEGVELTAGDPGRLDVRLGRRGEAYAVSLTLR